MSSFDPPGPPGDLPPPGYQQHDGYPPQPAYQSQPGQLGWQHQQPAAGGTNVLAIVSLVMSIVWLCGLGSLIAVVLGFVALRQIKRSGQDGIVLAIVGIALGVLGGIIGALLTAAVLIPVFLNETRTQAAVVECVESVRPDCLPNSG